jgi:glycosyltransferase involved in cell wall biosynthesis
MVKISIVITLHNEEENISPLLSCIDVALDGFDYEIVLVDDGSTDNTVQVIKDFEHRRVKLLILSRNYGQTPAMAAGIEAASGDYIVTMDGDLQNDPADIRPMLKKLVSENWDIVAGYRKNRNDAFLGRTMPSLIANRIIRALTGVQIRDYGCSLKVFRKEAAKNLDLYGELHRFIPVLASLQGLRITDIDVNHRPRKFGKSKYGLGRTFRVLSDLLLLLFFQKYFKRPIHFFGPLGMISFAIGACINFYLLIEKFLGNDIWGRPLLILAVTLLLSGIQFLTFGFVMEMQLRVYHESQHKKIYKIREVVEWRESDSPGKIPSMIA